jgi:hypothetical protein
MYKYPIHFIFALAIVFSFTSCDNEPLDDDFPVNQNPNPNNPGSPTDPGEGSTGDYWPTAVDNIWVYDTENADGSTNENDYEMISETTFEGLPAFELDNFFVQSQLDAFDDPTIELTGYLIKNEGNYSYYVPGSETNELGFMTTFQPLNYVFFKDYLEEGESFSDSFTFSLTISFEGDEDGIDFEPIDVSTTLDYTITVVQRDYEMTINEETFENVIHLNFASSYFDEEFNQTISSESDVYFAKDIGPIKIVDQNPTEGFTSEITSYELN